MSADVKKQDKQKKRPFRRFTRVVFVEDWGLKILALLFAAAVWVIFKAS